MNGMPAVFCMSSEQLVYQHSWNVPPIPARSPDHLNPGAHEDLQAFVDSTSESWMSPGHEGWHTPGTTKSLAKLKLLQLRKKTCKRLCQRSQTSMHRRLSHVRSSSRCESIRNSSETLLFYASSVFSLFSMLFYASSHQFSHQFSSRLFEASGAAARAQPRRAGRRVRRRARGRAGLAGWEIA